MSKVVVRLVGGLGNQMFGYAAGFALAPFMTGAVEDEFVAILEKLRGKTAYEIPWDNRG